MKSFIACALVCAGCQSVTEIVVRVQSLVPAGSTFVTTDGKSGTFNSVCLGIQPGGFATPVTFEPDPTFQQTVTLSTVPGQTGACLPVDLGVVAKGDWTGLLFGIEVRGSASCDAADNYMYSRAETYFVDGKVTLLDVPPLQSECAVDAAVGPGCKASEYCVAQQGTPGCNPLVATSSASYTVPKPVCP